MKVLSNRLFPNIQIIPLSRGSDVVHGRSCTVLMTSMLRPVQPICNRAKHKAQYREQHVHHIHRKGDIYFSRPLFPVRSVFAFFASGRQRQSLVAQAGPGRASVGAMANTTDVMAKSVHGTNPQVRMHVQVPKLPSRDRRRALHSDDVVSTAFKAYLWLA